MYLVEAKSSITVFKSLGPATPGVAGGGTGGTGIFTAIGLSAPSIEVFPQAPPGGQGAINICTQGSGMIVNLGVYIDSKATGMSIKTFQPQTGSVPFCSDLIVQASSSTPVGEYDVLVVGTGVTPQTIQRATFKLIVKQPPS